MSETMSEEEIKALVGRTFKLGNNARMITCIENLRVGLLGVWSGDVYWKRPGGKECAQPQWLPDFLAWLKNAEEVKG
jgi:hypothetical protein